MANTLKQMAKNAKYRMRTGYFADEYMARDNIPSLDKEEKRIYEKVVQILNSDEPITNPLGILIDERIFADLSPIDRERYVLELSKLYVKMTEKYIKERE